MGQFDNSNTDFNIDSFNVEPIILIQEFSSTEYYVDVSRNGRDTSKANWQIRRIVKTGAIWAVTQYPDGDQSFKYVWDDRLSYQYI